MTLLSLVRDCLAWPTNECFRQPLSRKSLLAFSYFLIRFGVIFYILFIPLGHAPREIGSITAFAGTLSYYLLDYRGSNLRRFRLKWLFIVFIAFLLFKVIHSVNIPRSWEVFYGATYKGLFLFFPGLEFVRRPRDLIQLIVLFAFMGLYEGLDGIWQFVNGQDLIQGTKASDRLTGSMGTPRVGNLTSLLLPIAFGLLIVLAPCLGRAKSLAITLIALFPSVFLLIGSETRSASVGLFSAIFGALLLIRGISWKYILMALGLGVLIGTCGPQDFSFEKALKGDRVQEMWPLAWQGFLQRPILGGGVHSYKPVAKSTPLGEEIEAEGGYIHPHPHNVYLQFLVETGVIGSCLALILFGSYLLWSAREIRLGLRSPATRRYYLLATCFWASFLGYLGTAFSAHNFFRPWWLGTAMLILGLLLASCLTGPSLEQLNDNE